MNTKKIITSVVAVVVVAGAAIGIAASSKKAATPITTVPITTTSTSTPVADTPSSPSGETSTSTYKDGTYTATGSYQSPGGPDQIAVTVTLKNDIITSASITPMPGDRTSAHYQSLFASGYQAAVVGQNIDTLKLSAVSGSSLTPIGFNDAIAQIRTQAKA